MIDQTNNSLAPQLKTPFDAKLATYPDSIREPIYKQMELMDHSTIYSIVENHDGTVSILYNTYAEAKEANDRQDSLVHLGGSTIVSKVNARLGSEYHTGHGDQTEIFTIGKLVEFQATGLIIVMLVIVGLSALTYLMSFIMKTLGLTEKAKPSTPASPVSKPVVQSSLDPNAPSPHPGFTNAQLQAFLSMAAVAALDIHPGISNEQLAVIFAVAAAEILGEPCTVVRFKQSNSTGWTSVVQNRVPSI